MSLCSSILDFKLTFDPPPPVPVSINGVFREILCQYYPELKLGEGIATVLKV